jgi:hypothetical protein
LIWIQEQSEQKQQSLMNMNETVTALASLAVSIVAAIVTLIWSVRSYQNQMNAQLFLEFTKRFEEVMQSFPKSAWPSRLNIEGKPPVKSKALSLSVLRYLNLCSEEYYLYKKGWLHKEIWEIWEEELIRTLQTPLFRREWQTLAGEFESYRSSKNMLIKFRRLLNRKQLLENLMATA